MIAARFFESIWRGVTYGKLAAVLAVALVAAVSLREAPLVRNVPPVRTIASRQALVRHGRIVRVTGVTLTGSAVTPERPRTPAVFEVEMTALAPDDWQLAPADILLEFDDAEPVHALPPDFDHKDTSLIFAPGVERTARLRFPAPPGIGENATPASVRLRRPRVRFILESG